MSIVTEPMDLGTVGARLRGEPLGEQRGEQYTHREQFAADVRRVFANSRLYNTNKRSRVSVMCCHLCIHSVVC
jgi:hypothetical protein